MATTCADTFKRRFKETLLCLYAAMHQIRLIANDFLIGNQIQMIALERAAKNNSK
jgi:hypothetical protein